MVAFLLEVGAEELPASFVDSAVAQWQQRIPASLQEAELAHESMQVFATPRRLAVVIEGLPTQQPDRILEIKGPPVSVAYQEEQLTAAGLGFAQKQKVDPASLQIRHTDKGSFVFAVQEISGQATATVLTRLAPTWITGLTGERLMRWGSHDLKFPRPIRWLVALLEDQILPIHLVTSEQHPQQGIPAGRISQGHRVLHPQPVVIGHARDYSQALVAAYVQPDCQQRQASIQKQVEALAQSAQGRAEILPELLAEVTQLVEWPTAVLGSFDREFLSLPVAVIKTVMVTHQRYFPVYDQAQPEHLRPHFITIANGDPAKAAIIAAGNSRVVRARLADAQFFYREDQKQPLEKNLESLAKVTFVENLGSMRDKVERIQEICRWIGKYLELPSTDQQSIDRTALLCKADLVCQMVFEFPELQGVMGSDYARHAGEPSAVVEGIAQHYWPLGAGDPLPTSLTGQVVGIADRLDSLVGLFKLGKIPSGSSDRFALRRAANSILLILWQAQLPLPLAALLQQVVDSYAATQPDTLRLLGEFLVQRMQTLMQEEHGLDADVVKAVIGEPGSDLAERALHQPVAALQQAKFLQQLRQSGRLQQLYPTLNRVSRLAAQGQLDAQVRDPAAVIKPQILKDPAEKALWQACQAVAQAAAQAEQQQDFQLLVTALQKATPTIDQFFEAVLVMDPDPNIKDNRLNLLGILRNNARLLGDFSAIVMAGES
ncbi:MAG: glycine--tRNA ligase subunit beta [Cyanobacteriota bacterium]|nr:glycine--tRNA ligase subunit beta [Cyanobacteriota bacterium]